MGKRYDKEAHKAAVAKYNALVASPVAKPTGDCDDATWDVYLDWRAARSRAEDAVYKWERARVGAYVGTIGKV